MNKYNILVAEDDADDYATLKDAFSEESNGSTLERSPDGEQLMLSLYRHLKVKCRPDLIILDINMPRLNGIDTLRKIRENEECSVIPVFMYSTSNDVDQMRKCYQLGAERFVTKGNHYQSVRNFAHHALEFLSDRQKPVMLFPQYESAVQNGSFRK